MPTRRVNEMSNSNSSSSPTTSDRLQHHKSLESRSSSVATTATVITTALDRQSSVYVMKSATTTTNWKSKAEDIVRTASIRSATAHRRVRFHDRRRGTMSKRMVSSTSLAWTCLLVQLVLSCVCLIASLAIIAAKLQSTSIHPEKQHISIELWSFCAMSFLMIWATIFSMLGLSGHKKILILPHILLLLIYSLFVGRVLLLVLLEFELTELNWLVGVCVLTTAEIFITCSIIFEFRTVTSMT
ncbi:unnamed protein product [Auanema sp. JU1783]|nr:unnamed protein product [Auanema sp. JU1783]